jgi:DNA-binding MarR family transcriptional regulator
VEKKREEQDERVVAVRLTAQGRALEKKARTIPPKVGSCLLKDDKEYARLKSELQEVLARLGG